MSGFVGVFYKRPSRNLEGVLREMSGMIGHRGHSKGRIVLDGRVACEIRHYDQAGYRTTLACRDDHLVIFDGCLFNEKQLKAAYGLPETSDVGDVVRAGYQRDGPASFARLDGSFAIVIYDRRDDHIVLARDRFGHRPLFLATYDGNLWCASEIKAILRDAALPRRLEPSQLSAAMAYGMFLGPETLFSGVQKVLPGHCFEGRTQSPLRNVPYYLPEPPCQRDLTRQQYQDRIWDTLGGTIRAQHARCPRLGVLLSSGTDSALVARQLSDVSEGSGIAVSIGATQWEEDESEEAAQIAATCNLAFFRSQITPQDDLLTALRNVIWKLEEPTRFDNAVALEATLGQLRPAVSGLLTGEYAEFFGSGAHRPCRRIRRFASLPAWLRSVLRTASPLLVHVPKVRGYAEYFHYTSLKDFVLHDYSWVLNLLKGADPYPSADHIDRLDRYLEGWEPANAYAILDVLAFWHGWIDRMERINIYYGIETFHPFQSNAMLQLALEMPYRFKVEGKVYKPCIRRLVAAKVSPAYAYGKKRQLASPTALWFRKSAGLRQAVLSLKSPKSRIREYLHGPTVDDYLRRYESSFAENQDVRRAVFRMLGFELWLRMFLES